MKKPENLQSLRYFIDASSQMHAQFLAASCLKDVFVECWPQISKDDKVQTKLFLIQMLQQKGANMDS